MNIRTKQLVAAFLAISMLVPLLAAGVAAASSPSCPGCPEPASTAEREPCHGSLVLSCCDDIATAPEADGRRYEAPCAVVDSSNDPASFNKKSCHALPTVPADLAWLTSALRLSVVLRT